MASNIDSSTANRAPVQCTYSSCQDEFDTHQQMIQHKVQAKDHHYCKRCDYDAWDWDDFLLHKVQAMMPFLIGDRKNDKHKRLKHLCCEFCGEDFKTFDGRMAHRRQMHQAPQHITCQGNGPVWDAAAQDYAHGECGMVFLRPSDLIEHYERGQCRFVSRRHFHSERQHMHVIKQILAAPDVFSGNIRASRRVAETDAASDVASVFPAENYEPSEADSSWLHSSTSGGVVLLDHDDAVSEASGLKSLLPKVTHHSLIDQCIDEDRGISCLARGYIPPHMRISPQVCTSSRSVSPVMAGETLRDIPYRSKMTKTSPTQETPPSPCSDSASVASTARPEDLPDSPTSSPHDHILRDSVSISAYIDSLDALSQAPINWSAFCLDRYEEADNNDPALIPHSTTPNLFDTPWYDPKSHDFDPEILYHPFLQKYKCPFARCELTFDLQGDMEAHLSRSHVIVANKCRSCSKTFSSVTGLVRHFESSVRGSTCWVASSRDFAEVLKEVTGGFLVLDQTRAAKGSAEEAAQKLVGYETVKIHDEDGRMHTKTVRIADGQAGVMEKVFYGSGPGRLDLRMKQLRGGKSDTRSVRSSGSDDSVRRIEDKKEILW